MFNLCVIRFEDMKHLPKPCGNCHSRNDIILKMVHHFELVMWLLEKKNNQHQLTIQNQESNIAVINTV